MLYRGNRSRHFNSSESVVFPIWSFVISRNWKMMPPLLPYIKKSSKWIVLRNSLDYRCHVLGHSNYKGRVPGQISPVVIVMWHWCSITLTGIWLSNLDRLSSYLICYTIMIDLSSQNLGIPALTLYRTPETQNLGVSQSMIWYNTPFFPFIPILLTLVYEFPMGITLSSIFRGKGSKLVVYLFIIAPTQNFGPLEAKLS